MHTLRVIWPGHGTELSKKNFSTNVQDVLAQERHCSLKCCGDVSVLTEVLV